MSEETTLKKQILQALRDGDSPKDLICFYRDRGNDGHPIRKGSFSSLPDWEYDPGFGEAEGPPFIGFSERYVYIRTQYDGSEDVVAIPRHPKYVTWLPWLGG